MAPAMPPTRLGTMSARKRGSAARSSRRYPQALPTVPGQMATVEVALAVTESSPSQISVGNDTSVPPPATELIEPARKAAPKETAACGRSSRSEEHTSELQSLRHLVCRLLLEKK